MGKWIRGIGRGRGKENFNCLFYFDFVMKKLLLKFG